MEYEILDDCIYSRQLSNRRIDGLPYTDTDLKIYVTFGMSPKVKTVLITYIPPSFCKHLQGKNNGERC